MQGAPAQLITLCQFPLKQLKRGLHLPIEIDGFRKPLRFTQAKLIISRRQEIHCEIPPNSTASMQAARQGGQVAFSLWGHGALLATRRGGVGRGGAGSAGCGAVALLGGCPAAECHQCQRPQGALLLSTFRKWTVPPSSLPGPHAASLPLHSGGRAPPSTLARPATPWGGHCPGEPGHKSSPPPSVWPTSEEEQPGRRNPPLAGWAELHPLAGLEWHSLPWEAGASILALLPKGCPHRVPGGAWPEGTELPPAPKFFSGEGLAPAEEPAGHWVRRCRLD